MPGCGRPRRARRAGGGQRTFSTTFLHDYVRFHSQHACKRKTSVSRALGAQPHVARAVSRGPPPWPLRRCGVLNAA